MIAEKIQIESQSSIPIIQREVNAFKDDVWNVHRVGAQKNTELPDEIPNHIYNFPGEYGLCECGKYPQLTVVYVIFYKNRLDMLRRNCLTLTNVLVNKSLG